MTDKEIIDRAKDAEKRTGFGELVHSPISKGVNSAYGIGFIEGMVEYRNFLQEESVSDDLEEAADKYSNNEYNYFDVLVTECDGTEHWMNDKGFIKDAFKEGAKWKQEHLSTEVKEVDKDCLTWEDLATIEKIGDDFVKHNQTPMSDEEFYKEVLKRFKLQK